MTKCILSCSLKPENQHFLLIAILSFQIQSAGKQSRAYRKCVTVKILKKLHCRTFANIPEIYEKAFWQTQDEL